MSLRMAASPRKFLASSASRRRATFLAAFALGVVLIIAIARQASQESNSSSAHAAVLHLHAALLSAAKQQKVWHWTVAKVWH